MEYPLLDVLPENHSYKDINWLEDFVNILHELFPLKKLAKFSEFKDYIDSAIKLSPISRGRPKNALRFFVALEANDYIEVEIITLYQRGELFFDITAFYIYQDDHTTSYFKTVMPHIAHVSSKMIHSASFFYVKNDNTTFIKIINSEIYSSKVLWRTMISYPNYLPSL